MPKPLDMDKDIDEEIDEALFEDEIGAALADAPPPIPFPLEQGVAPADTTPPAEKPAWYESLARGAGQSASGYMGDEFGGLLAKLAAPETVRTTRGMTGTPTGQTSYDVERDAQRAENVEAEVANPNAYMAGEVGGAIATAAAPGGAAAKGAGAVSKVAPTALSRLARSGMGRKAAVVAGDALAGGAAAVGMSEKEGLESLEDAPMGAAMGAGGGMALRGLIKAPGAIKRAATTGKDKMSGMLQRKTAPRAMAMATEGAPEPVVKSAQEFATSPAKRAALLRNERGHEDAVREITDSITESTAGMDEIMDAAGVGMKKEPIEAHMIAEDIDAKVAIDASETLVLEMFEQVEKIAESARDSGKTALAKILGRQTKGGRKAEESAIDDAFVALQKARDAGGPAAAADAFMALDNMKRRIGRAVKASDRGVGADANTSEGMKDVYEAVRKHLEAAEIWGEGASGVQTEINAAITPWIRKQKGMAAVTTEARGLVSADPWHVRGEGDPAWTSNMLKQAGTIENDVNEKMLKEGLDASAKLSQVMSKHYNIPVSVKLRANKVSEAADQVRGKLDGWISDAKIARELEDLAREAAANPVGGNPLARAPMIGPMIEHMQGSPAGRIRSLARVDERLANAPAGPQLGPELPPGFAALLGRQAPRAGATVAGGATAMTEEELEEQRRLEAARRQP